VGSAQTAGPMYIYSTCQCLGNSYKFWPEHRYKAIGASYTQRQFGVHRRCATTPQAAAIGSARHQRYSTWR
jgi:hypothetical protein